MNLNQLIEKYSINQNALATAIKMPVNTFRVKLNKNVKGYGFTDKELAAIGKALNNMSNDIIKYNSQQLSLPLKTISKKAKTNEDVSSN